MTKTYAYRGYIVVVTGWSDAFGQMIHWIADNRSKQVIDTSTNPKSVIDSWLNAR